MKISIVTDSTADIPPDLAEQYAIHVIPNILMIDGQSLEDGISISRQEFYNQLPAMKALPTTGTASSGTYQELYDKLLIQGANYILSIHASHLLSGIVNAASIAAQVFYDRVKVIDSFSVTLGLGFQVLAAAEAIASGASLESVLSLLDHLRQRAKVIAMLDTLEYIRRSGRVSWARARLGDFLNIKPFVEVKGGMVHSLGDVRTRRKGIERLISLAIRLGPIDRLAVLHTNVEVEARQIAEKLKMDNSQTPIIVNVTTVIGTHVGPNGLGIAALVR
jgi:DegV family protein with EDD domain